MHFFDEIKTYVGFTESDAARIREMGPLLGPERDAVVEAFYDALLANTRTRGVFEGPDQIERLRVSLGRWLDEMMAGVYDDDYFERRRRIGKVHVDVGLLPHFMFGAMNVMRMRIKDIVCAHPFFETHEPQLYCHSLDKILDIELTIMVQSYWDAMMQLKLQMPAALAGGLAHEIRNPLNSIGLSLTLMERRLRKSGVDGDDYTAFFDTVRSEIRRIQGLTSEIMDLSKPIDITPTWHDLREMIQELRTIHEPALQASNIELVTEVVGHNKIWCDGERFKQVLLNLLNNAADAIDDQGTIAIRCQGDDKGWIVAFSDDGSGMPPALKYRIFDVFFSTKASGTGLGLPICRKIVEAHRGSIDVTSYPGRGTTFTVYMPRPLQSSGTHEGLT